MTRNKSRTKMAKTTLLLLLIFILLITLFQNTCSKIHITDDLDDVEDNEEDDTWKEWGKQKKKNEKFDPPPEDLEKMDIGKMQEEMMKRQVGPSFGFVKLRIGGVKRTTDMITAISKQWSKIARTGAIDVKFMGVDVSTIMFTLEKGQDTLELKEFILSQPEAYEVKIGDQLFRRPGDPSFDDVFAEDYDKKHKKDEGHTHPSIEDHERDEL